MSSDGGAVWTQIDSWLGEGGACIIHPEDQDLVLCGGQGTSANSNWSFGLCRSTNGGTNWQRTFIEQTARGWCTCLEVAPSGPDTVWAGGWIEGIGALVVSTDRGATWAGASSSPLDTVCDLAVMPDNAGHLFAATTGGVFRTTDAGATWNRVLSELGMRAVVISPTGPDTVAAAGDEGAFLSYDAGANWTQVNEGLDVTEVMSLLFAGEGWGELFAGTAGGAAYKWNPQTGVWEETGQRALPVEGRVPTLVREILPLRGAGGAVLLDLSGRKVMDLVPGSNDVSQVAPGVYFVREEQAEATAKVVIQR